MAGLSKSTLVDFIKNNFIGSRIAVAGTGAVSSDALVRQKTGPALRHSPHTEHDSPIILVLVADTTCRL